MNLWVNKDTEIYCSFAEKAGNTGCQMMNTAFHWYGLNKIYKSFSVDNGRKCVNLYRLGYPGEDKDNLCTDLENDCNGELKTSLWNEFIATPIKICSLLLKFIVKNLK